MALDSRVETTVLPAGTAVANQLALSPTTAIFGSPVQQARLHVPVGIVNPSPNYLAGDLRGIASEGVGRHWWTKLTAVDLRSRQLPDPAGQYRRPPGW
jgi:hypothetical protein